MTKVIRPEDLYRNQLAWFARLAFEELYGAKLPEHWYFDVVCDQLTRSEPGGINRSIINAPPRYFKSFLVSIAWPLYLLGHYPTLKIMTVAGTAALAKEQQLLREQLASSIRIRSLFPHLRPSRVGSGLRFPHGGTIVPTAMNRSRIGQGADMIIIDDPQTPASAKIAAERELVHKRYTEDVFTRLNKKGSGTVVIVMQRLHLDDLCGFVTRHERWTELYMPALTTRDINYTLSDGRVKIHKAGEALFPEIESKETLRTILEQIRALSFYAQYLQNPLGRNDNEHRIFINTNLVPLDYDPYNWKERGNLETGIRTVDRVADIVHAFFGGPKIFDTTGYRKMTPQEWEIGLRLQQAELLERVRQDMIADRNRAQA